MYHLEKIRSSPDTRYDRLLDGVALHIINAICASHQTPSQVFLRYVDHSYPSESFDAWLGDEYPQRDRVLSSDYAVEGVRIPDYENGQDVYRIFEASPRVDGAVDDKYLSTLGHVAVK